MERIDLGQKLEYKGYWYLPTAPEDRVAGVLTYHPNEKIILELMGYFGEYSWSILTKREEDPVILGRTADGKDSNGGTYCPGVPVSTKCNAWRDPSTSSG